MYRQSPGVKVTQAMYGGSTDISGHGKDSTEALLRPNQAYLTATRPNLCFVAVACKSARDYAATISAVKLTSAVIELVIKQVDLAFSKNFRAFSLSPSAGRVNTTLILTFVNFVTFSIRSNSPSAVAVKADHSIRPALAVARNEKQKQSAIAAIIRSSGDQAPPAPPNCVGGWVLTGVKSSLLTTTAPSLLAFAVAA